MVGHKGMVKMVRSMAWSAAGYEGQNEEDEEVGPCMCVRVGLGGQVRLLGRACVMDRIPMVSGRGRDGVQGWL